MMGTICGSGLVLHDLGLVCWLCLRCQPLVLSPNEGLNQLDLGHLGAGFNLA